MIQIKDIDFRYPGSKHLVFRDFSLELKENNIYGLLGKNGTGKSTLLYLISGLLRQQQGTILVDGISAQDRKAEMLKDIFMVPEEFELPNVSLATYVKMNQGFYPNFSQEVLDRCLKDFDLPLSLKLNELSMGQKKKVFMSFALATGTRFLLMDEPTNGLDIPSKSQFRKVIANNMTEDRTLIILYSSGARCRVVARPHHHHEPEPASARRFGFGHLREIHLRVPQPTGNGRHRALRRANPTGQCRHLQATGG